MPGSQLNTTRFYLLHGAFSLLAWLAAFSVAYLAYPATRIKNECELISYGSTDTLNNYWFLWILFAGYALAIPLTFLLIKRNNANEPPVWREFFSFRYAAFLMLLASVCLYTLGLFMPILRTTRYILCESSTSLPDSIRFFMTEGEVFLAWVIALFSIGFPILKYLMMYLAFARQKDTLLGKALSHIGKFSMMDVFVTGLVIFIMKQNQSFLLNVSSDIGIIYFAIAILLSIVVSVSLYFLQRKETGKESTVS